MRVLSCAPQYRQRYKQYTKKCIFIGWNYADISNLKITILYLKRLWMNVFSSSPVSPVAHKGTPETFLWMHPANERRRYILTLSLIGYAHTQNGPCIQVRGKVLKWWWWWWWWWWCDLEVTKACTVKPVYNDHLLGYFSAFWSSSRWPLASRRQILLSRVNWYLQSSLEHITE